MVSLCWRVSELFQASLVRSSSRLSDLDNRSLMSVGRPANAPKGAPAHLLNLLKLWLGTINWNQRDSDSGRPNWLCCREDTSFVARSHEGRLLSGFDRVWGHIPYLPNEKVFLVVKLLVLRSLLQEVLQKAQEFVAVDQENLLYSD